MDCLSIKLKPYDLHKTQIHFPINNV
jgi:hypothetical protein